MGKNRQRKFFREELLENNSQERELEKSCKKIW